MSNKPKIVVFIDWYVPAYKAGGPIRSVYNLIETLYTSYDFYVITSNSDIDCEPLSEIETNKWVKQSKANVIYFTPEEQNIRRYKKEIKKIAPSKIYLNSLFSLRFTLVPLLAFKKSYDIVIAPRGMLGPESLAIKSTKKKLFLTVSKILKLYKNVTWHVSTGIEAVEVNKVFGQNESIKTASNLALVSEEFKLLNKQVGKLSILMVGRIVPIKNILFFLIELSKLDKQSLVNVSIVGPKEDQEYYKLCKNALKELPEHVIVNFKGSMPSVEVGKQYNQHHLLISTSLNENYGHSIAEALTYGRPIIVSNNTPWKNLRELGIGVNLDLEFGSFTKEIQHFINMGNAEFAEFQKRAKQYALDKLKSKKEIQDSINLFKN